MQVETREQQLCGLLTLLVMFFFQVKGYQWMATLYENGINGILVRTKRPMKCTVSAPGLDLVELLRGEGFILPDPVCKLSG